MKLNYFNALQHISQATGVWVIYGDEPLLEQNLIDSFRTYWQHHQIERQRYDISHINDWKNVFTALNSLSLFAQQLAIEVHSTIKPDASLLKQLTHYAQHPEGNFLLIILPKQDSNSLKSAFFQCVEQYGTIVPLHTYTLNEQQAILQHEAQKLNIQLDHDAWQWLLQHHEHHLLAARNSLIHISDTFPDQQHFNVEQLISCLQDQSRYSIYDLSDHLLHGHLALCIKIFRYLIESAEPINLILWTLSKDIRLLMQLYEQPDQATQLGIWKTKLPLYQHAVSRLSPHHFLQFPELLLRIDQSIKGVSSENPYHLCQQLIALCCGSVLFYPTSS